MTTKLDRMVTYFKGLLTIKSHNTLIAVILQSHMATEYQYISTTRMPMTTTVGRIVAQLYATHKVL